MGLGFAEVGQLGFDGLIERVLGKVWVKRVKGSAVCNLGF